MSLNYKFIGQQVKNARNNKQISQAELAEQIDVSVPYISRIETAVKNVSLEVLVNIANTLGVTVDFLLHGNQTNDLTEYQSALSLLIHVSSTKNHAEKGKEAESKGKIFKEGLEGRKE